MKYAVFAVLLAFGVPLMAAFAIRFEKVRGWLLSVLVFSICLGPKGNMHFESMEFYRGPDRGFEVTLTHLLALALGIAAIVKRPGRISWLPYNSIPMFLYFALSAVALAWVQDSILTWFSLVKLAGVYIVYWCVVNTLRTGVPPRAVWRGLIAIAFFFAEEALKQKYLYGIYRIPATFDHSNTVPLFLDPIMPLLLAFGLADRSLTWKESLVSLVGALAMVFTTFMTYSRAGTVLSVAVLCATVGFAVFRARSPRVMVAATVLAGCLAIGGAFTLRSIIERFAEAPESSAQARNEFNRAADLMLYDHPFGIGTNQFSAVLTRSERYRQDFVVMADEKQGGVCHHIYRLTAAETGWAGIVVFVFILLRFAWRMFRSAWRQRGFESVAQVGMLLGTAALHLNGFLEWAFRLTPVMTLYLVTCAVAVTLEPQRSAVPPSPAPPPKPSFKPPLPKDWSAPPPGPALKRIEDDE